MDPTTSLPLPAALIDRMGHAAQADGFAPIAGRLFGTLLLSPEPLSLDQLAATLGVSKASVSTDARRLLEHGIVERVTRPGDRRDYYELAPDFFAQIIRVRVARWRRVRDLARTLDPVAAGLSPVVRDRLESIDAIHAAVSERVDQALAEWETRTAARARTRAARGRRH